MDLKMKKNIIINIHKKISLKIINKYLNRIINLDYNSFTNINKYTNQIQSSFLYLKKLNYKILKILLVYLLFKELLSSSNSFISKKNIKLLIEIDLL